MIKRSLTATLLMFLHAVVLAASVTFTPDTTTVYANPERGWWWGGPAGSGYWCGSGLTSHRDGQSASNGSPYPQLMRLFYYSINPASTTTSDVSTDLACVRNAGVKVMMSFEYCGASNCNEGVSLATAQAQLTAYKNVIYANRDVIAQVRISTIGGWGEGASWAGTTPVPANVREGIRDTVLSIVPPEIPVLSRNPPRVQEYSNNVPLNAKTAFLGNWLDRIGFHNDCFLADTSDRNTYIGANASGGAIVPDYTHSIAQQRAYAAASSKWQVFSTETCPGSGGSTDGRFQCSGGQDNASQTSGILPEGERYSVHDMDAFYYTGFMDSWTIGGCMTSVTNLMGYRYQLDSVAHNDTVARGAKLTVTVNMRNKGWGRIISPRLLYVRLTIPGTPTVNPIVCAFGPKLRTLPPMATKSETLVAKCPIPSNAATGSRNVHIEAHDLDFYPTATIVGHNIQFANANSGGQTWDSTNRRFNTGTTVTVN